MRKTRMLATTSAIALSVMVGLSAAALATGKDPETDPRFTGTFAFAENDAQVTWNSAASVGSTNAALIFNTGASAMGVVQFNQNVGANSALQNSAAVAQVIMATAGDFTIAVADADNEGDVTNNLSARLGTSDSATINNNSFSHAMGVINVNQNAGANSLLQNATALANFDTNCNTCRGDADFAGSFSFADNEAEVSQNGTARAPSLSNDSTASTNINGSFGNATGIVQVNQNAGANSALQNAAAVSHIDGVRVERMSIVAAVADADNDGDVTNNWNARYDSDATATIENGAFNGAQGVVNVNQNSGENSLLQNATSVASFDTNCNCFDASPSFAGTFAFADNEASVDGNHAFTEGSDDDFSLASANIQNSFTRVQGVIQVNQNAGANSGLQNSAAVASIQARAGSFTAAVAWAVNIGDVAGNSSTRVAPPKETFGASNRATINGSFSGAQGVIQVNQNAGDNSLLQNSAALADFRFCGPGCANVNLASVAVAANYGTVTRNYATALRSSASATISNSFGGAQGMINVNQNAGANSLLQNASAVASIRPH